ncbi:universal stress protein [Baekduia sp. Peel2402]|uniref:universal stress protein n=1 Tax=Baekduia sp. Peel2402 TaxID=3458296 RepID=UPI00403E3DFA
MSTFTKVIVGDDGLAGGADALALARTLAPNAELILASTYPWDPAPSRATQSGYSAILREDTLATLAERVRAADLPESVRTVAVADSSPGRGLHRIAESEGADLIVIGSAHHGPVGRQLLGDVGRAVLHGAPCPVAVAPRAYAAKTAPQTIGVAFDHSPEAKLALDVALELAHTLGASVTIREVVAADLLPAAAGIPMINIEELTEELRDDAQQRLDAMLAALPDTESLTITAEAVVGSTADRLEELSHQVGLVVTGSRGYGTIRRVVLGSTADRLIHRSPAPVIVVPRTAVTAELPDPASKVDACPQPASSSTGG